MKHPRSIPFVEITTRPSKGRKRQTTLEHLAESHGPRISPRKKRRHDVDLDLIGLSSNLFSSKTDLAPTNSPTVSEFLVYVGNGPPTSPTVSDFEVPTTTTSSVAHPTSQSSDNEAPKSSRPWTRSRKAQPIFLTSGHNVKLEQIRSNSEPPTKKRCVAQVSRSQVPAPQTATPSTSTGVSENTDISNPYVYEILDELREDEDLTIPGETASSTEAEDNDLPVRLLQDFTIYDISTNVVVPIMELAMISSRKRFGASGIAKAWSGSDEDDEDEHNEEDEDEDSGLPIPNIGERVKLSEILAFDIHHFSEITRSLDSQIYIRTSFAWYILDTPSVEYRSYFVRFWIQHRTLHLLTTAAMEAPHLKYDEFIESLQLSETQDQNIQTTWNFLGRELTQDDIESDDVKAYIISALPDICARNRIRIYDVPAIKSYLGSWILADYGTDYSYSHSPQKGKTQLIFKKRQINNKEKAILKHRSQTVVTPIVSHIAKNLFKGALEVAGSSTFDELDGNIAAEIDNIQAHHADPKSMKWGADAPEGGQYYSSIIMDGIEYFVGDDVMVNPGEDEDIVRARNAESKASQSANTYANRLWFCRICYFFEKKVDGKLVKMFHGQWFAHGSKTVLQETAHSRSLFLTNKCESNPTASIFKKCMITILKPEDMEVLDDGQPDANDYHCRMVYNEDNVEFLSLPEDNEITHLFSLLPSHKPCISCGMKAQEEQLEELRYIDGGFTQYGVKYHQHDFIYIRPHENTGLLQIAQIILIERSPTQPTITVRYFGRYCNYIREQSRKHGDLPPVFSDQHRLYQQKETKNIPPEIIDGLCYVCQSTDEVEIDHWVKHSDHFYVNLEEEDDGSLVNMDNTLTCCNACHQEQEMKHHHNEELMNKNSPLVGLELFSGAGGLGTGMDMSGFIETRYAVEFSPSAAATYQTNHPLTTVYCQDSSLLLKHVIETEEGKNPTPLLSNDSRKYCPPMPKKGDVDIIYGGPPCQSFSHANHMRRADDIRSTLPGNMLSYVEYYNPSYFLLENVPGLLDYPLMSNNTKDGSFEGGIKGGVVKFITRTLIALGYQVRYNLLQAAQYGAPQGRRRVIFLAAKCGIKLPSHPAPVYAFPKGVNRSTLPTGEYLLPVSRSVAPGNLHQCAPLQPITVNDAIGDLLPFDWINPHAVIPAKKRDKEEAARRQKLGIAQFDAVMNKGEQKLPGFPEGAAYATEPRNRYQKWLRQKMVQGVKVQGHYTKRFGSRVVESTTNIPLRPLADHRDLPLVLLPNHAKPTGDGEQDRKALFGRMDGESQFKCAMTVVAPTVKRSWVVHPLQKRIISVRECARAQGFPDHYVFKSAGDNPQGMVNNQIRQIGNAVPVPLALALGNSIGATLLEEWGENAREGSPVV